MEDSDILNLYFSRDEAAIGNTAKKYGKRLLNLSYSITECESDTEECVNDTYLEAWNRIPPARPDFFFAWLAKITRNFSYKIWEKKKAKKRSAQIISITEELAECVPSDADVVSEAESARLSAVIDGFIRELDETSRLVFMRRYFWSHSIAQISSATGFSHSKIKSMLFRMRNKLKQILEKEDLWS